VEARSIVDAGCVVRANEERTSQAAIRDAAVVRTFWVRKSKTRWARFSLDSFMDVGCSYGRRAVLASNTREGDVLFDWSASQR
jgi:hypothetical protein